MNRINLEGRASEVIEATKTLANELGSLNLPEPTFEHGLPKALQGNAPSSTAVAAGEQRDWARSATRLC